MIVTASNMPCISLKLIFYFHYQCAFISFQNANTVVTFYDMIAV